MKLCYFLAMAITFINCRSKEPCTPYILVKNKTSNSKVFWINVSYPDTSFSCSTSAKLGITANGEREISFGQPSKNCWEQQLEYKPVQIFIMNEQEYIDSTCEVLGTHPEMYNRKVYSLDQMKQLNWTIEISE